MARRLGEHPLGATGTGERAQRGLAEGRAGRCRRPEGAGLRSGLAALGEGEGASTFRCVNKPCLPRGPPPARLQLRSVRWGRGGLVIFVAWTMPARCPRSRFTGERRAARARPAARRRGCSLLRGDNVRGRRPTSPSWALRLEQPLAPLWTPFTMSPLHPSPFDGCLGATPGWQNLRPLWGQRADGVTTAPCSVGG